MCRFRCLRFRSFRYIRSRFTIHPLPICLGSSARFLHPNTQTSTMSCSRAVPEHLRRKWRAGQGVRGGGEGRRGEVGWRAAAMNLTTTSGETWSSFRAVSCQFQSNFRAIRKMFQYRFQGRFRAISEPIEKCSKIGSRAVSERFQSSSRAIPSSDSL